MRNLKQIVIAAGALLGASQAIAGTLIVGGDTTPTFSLGDTAFGGNAGNRAFYDNVRGNAQRVVISQRSFTAPGFPNFANVNVATFYRGTAGVSVVESSGAIGADLLAGAGLLIVQFPNVAFTEDESAAIKTFVRGNGTVLLVGESTIINPSFPSPGPSEGSRSNAILNDLLMSIGASIRVADDAIGCCGTLTASGPEIASDPLTNGVSSFNYGAASSVTGGKALLYAPVQPPLDRSLRAFFATETLTSSVPEPASWALMIAGMGFVGVAMRRRRPGGAIA